MNTRNLLLITSSFVVMLALSGCQNDGAQLTGPDNNSQQAPQFLQLPPEMALSKGVSTRGDITAEKGGELKLDYKESTVGKFELHVDLKFDKGSVSNDFSASVAMDAAYLMNSVDLQFGPHGTYFLQPARLSIQVKGMDLTGYTDKSVLHLYYDNNGKWEQMKGDVTIKVKDGQLECKNGELPHFSRYAFGN